jgi:hypothetical protein
LAGLQTAVLLTTASMERKRIALKRHPVVFFACRANRLEEANREVSRRLVTAMETIRAVLDR